MFASKPRIEIVTRMFLIAVVLFNAFAPVTVYASSQPRSDLNSASASVQADPASLPDEGPIQLDPPQIPLPQERSPEPDTPPSPVPPKDLVEFTIISDPAIIPTNGTVTFHVAISNHSE